MPRVAHRSVGLTWLVLGMGSLWTSASEAEEGTTLPSPDARGTSPTVDRFELAARSETYVQLFRRALLPGPNGALVATETALPVHEYLSASARAVDSPWHEDSVDLEFAAWGRVWPTSSDQERPFDGDLQVASMRYHAGPAWVRLGRQQVTGGAARYARFDGVMLGVERLGFFGEGYAGFGVLPRWNARPGYHRLGAHEGELSPYASDDLERESTWLAGGRLGYAVSRWRGSVSVHEERVAGDVGRRNLGVDLGGQPLDKVSFGTGALVELDSQRLADTRIWLDAAPVSWIDLGAEFLRAEPALLLSRQSVLSVFTTNAYEEIGATASVRPWSWLRIETNGYAGIYDDTAPGSRAEIAVRFAFDRAHLTIARLAYTRVVAASNGYHSLRSSLRRNLSERFTASLEAYGYFYDRPVASYSASSFYAGTLAYRAFERCELLIGASVARSPYSPLDAQSLLRAVIEFDTPRVAVAR